MAADALAPPPAEEGVPFGRSRFLKIAGAALFGFTAQRLIGASSAHGIHITDVTPCRGYPMCHCCNGRYCCGDCHEHSVTYDGSSNSFFPDGTCWTGTNCWWTCWGGQQYRCCDWHEIVGERHSACICRGLIYRDYCPYGSD